MALQKRRMMKFLFYNVYFDKNDPRDVNFLLIRVVLGIESGFIVLPVNWKN